MYDVNSSSEFHQKNEGLVKRFHMCAQPDLRDLYSHGIATFSKNICTAWESRRDVAFGAVIYSFSKSSVLVSH